MKKLFVLLCALTLVLGMVGSASALGFTLDSYAVKLNDSDPGLVLYWEPILEVSASIGDLEVGDAVTFKLFELGTKEESVGWDDIWWKDIEVDFDFSSPDVLGTGEGHTRGKYIGDKGVVRWDNPTSFIFGDTGLFTIDLLDAKFGTPGSADIFAKLTYVSADTAAAPVPEPATILLMGTGLLGLVAYSRKRYSKKS